MLFQVRLYTIARESLGGRRKDFHAIKAEFGRLRAVSVNVAPKNKGTALGLWNQRNRHTRAHHGIRYPLNRDQDHVAVGRRVPGANQPDGQWNTLLKFEVRLKAQ